MLQLPRALVAPLQKGKDSLLKINQNLGGVGRYKCDCCPFDRSGEKEMFTQKKKLLLKTEINYPC